MKIEDLKQISLAASASNVLLGLLMKSLGCAESDESLSDSELKLIRDSANEVSEMRMKLMEITVWFLQENPDRLNDLAADLERWMSEQDGEPTDAVCPTRIQTYTCSVCGRTHTVQFPGTDVPEIVFDLKAHLEGWTRYMGTTYCPEHTPKGLEIDKARTVYRYDTWTNWPNCVKTDLGIPYDPWFTSHTNYQLCSVCEHHGFDYEDDGSSWDVCAGANLYEGHVTHPPCRGRLCPYWSHPLLPIGRELDKNCFDEMDYIYDGD